MRKENIILDEATILGKCNGKFVYGLEGGHIFTSSKKAVIGEASSSKIIPNMPAESIKEYTFFRSYVFESSPNSLIPGYHHNSKNWVRVPAKEVQHEC